LRHCSTIHIKYKQHYSQKQITVRIKKVNNQLVGFKKQAGTQQVIKKSKQMALFKIEPSRILSSLWAQGQMPNSK
jgi:hypothetical protein